MFAVRKSESALSVLFSELSTRQEARAVPASGLRVRHVFTDDRQATAGKQICGKAAVPEAHIEGRGNDPMRRREFIAGELKRVRPENNVKLPIKDLPMGYVDSGGMPRCQ